MIFGQWAYLSISVNSKYIYYKNYNFLKSVWLIREHCEHSPILFCGKLRSYANMLILSKPSTKNIVTGSAVAIVTYWCISLLGFSALLPVSFRFIA